MVAVVPGHHEQWYVVQVPVNALQDELNKHDAVKFVLLDSGTGAPSAKKYTVIWTELVPDAPA